MLSAMGLLLLAPQVVVTDQQQLRPSDSFKEDYFGSSIDVLDERAVVGAPRHRHPVLGQRTGAAYVFEKGAGAFHEQMLLLPSNLGAASSKLWQYGYSVACDPTRVIVGAPDAKLPGLAGTGLAFVYIRAGVTWVEEAVLESGETSSWFGLAVDLHGISLIVGAVWPGTGPNLGAAYVFHRGTLGWEKQVKLQSNDIALNDGFGMSVIHQGAWAFVGAPRADGTESSSGAVYVFRRDGTEWSQTQKLTPLNGRTGDEFGTSLAFDGTTLVVGAPLHDEGPWIDVGAAYVFQAQISFWVEEQCLVPKGYFQEDHAGAAVAVHANRIAVGAPEGNWFQPGRVVLYSQSPEGWLEHRELSPVGAPPNADIGRSLAMDRAQLAVGAPTATTAAWNQAGAGYVLDLSSQGDRPTFYCSAKQDSKGCVPRIYHIGQPSVSAPQTGATYEVGGWDLQSKKPVLLVYSKAGAASAPYAGGLLCVQAPIVRTPVASTGEGGWGAPCDGKFSFDFNAWIAGGSDPGLIAGQPVWMQYWYRDPAGTLGDDVGLSQGIYIVIGP